MSIKFESSKIFAPSISTDPAFITEGDNPPKDINQNYEKIETKVDETTLKNQTLLPNENQLLKNLRIEQNRVIPYATFHIHNFQIDEIKNILSAKKLFIYTLISYTLIIEEKEILGKAWGQPAGEREAADCCSLSLKCNSYIK